MKFFISKIQQIILIFHKNIKNTVLAKALVDSIASVNDENYAGYRLQFDKAYKLLIKTTNPIKKSMSINY